MDKASGEDKIPPRLVKMASNFLSEPIANIINTAIDTNIFPDRAKRASVTPTDKGGNDKHIYTNYRPVSVLNTFSKIIELAIFDQLTKHTNHFLSIFVSAYRKMYGTQHVLIRLLEKWREQINHNEIVGTVLLGLCKAFDCIPYDLLITKRNAYGFDKNTLTLLFSYLKNRKQPVRIKTRNLKPRSLNLQINDTEITLQPSVELLGITIDNELNFDQHISRFCKSAGCQLNALFRLKNYLNFEQKKV